MKLEIILPLGVAALAILVPLITTYIQNRNQRYLKKLEVILNRRLDAYSDFSVYAAAFSYSSSRDGMEYQRFLEIQQRARIVATNNVSMAIKRVSVEANRLRAEPSSFEKGILQGSKWYDAMELATEEMRTEISNLTGKI